MAKRRRRKPVFQNWQWKVTRYGIATHSNDYSIKADRLRQTREVDGCECYDWPLHMATKSEWVLKTEFNEAFLKAMDYHHGGYDEAMYERTLKAIRQQTAALFAPREVQT